MEKDRERSRDRQGAVAAPYQNKTCHLQQRAVSGGTRFQAQDPATNLREEFCSNFAFFPVTSASADHSTTFFSGRSRSGFIQQGIRVWETSLTQAD